MIDAHSHVFPDVNGQVGDGRTRGIGHGRASIGGDVQQVIPDYGETTDFTAAMSVAELDAAGIERTVLLQGPFWGECNDFAAAAVRQYPDRFIAQAYFDPWTDGWQTRLDGILETPEFRGVKIEFSVPTGLSGVHPGARLDDPKLDPAWALLQRQNRVLTLDLGGVGSASYQTDAVAHIATGHPDLTVVICHLGQAGPALATDAALRQLWQAQIELGKLPNVWFDTASLPAYFRDEGDPFPSCRDYIERAIDIVGPEKIMWGSDIPGNLRVCSYARLTRLGRNHTDFLPAAEQALVLKENAQRVYGK
jgi:predicted TIM-barrel fold metal-dependent hydrolase